MNTALKLLCLFKVPLHFKISFAYVLLHCVPLFTGENDVCAGQEGFSEANLKV